VDVAAVSQEMEQARATFHELVAGATAADLRRRSAGTRWTNRQLLFHMVFGYLVVRTLLPLVRAFGAPYHFLNYAGSCVGGLLSPAAMADLLDRSVDALQRGLVEEGDGLQLRMAFPTSWDPYFTETMTVGDVYHFGTQHFLHHRHQLTLPARSGHAAP
jgi:hypothetical protein